MKIYLFKQSYTHVKKGGGREGGGRERERETDTDRNRFPILLFTFQMTSMARIELGQSQVPGDSSGSPTWVQETKNLIYSRLISQAH